MIPEYVFEQAEKRKFYHPDAAFNFSIYLVSDVNELFNKLAEEAGNDIPPLVNDRLRNNIKLIPMISLP